MTEIILEPAMGALPALTPKGKTRIPPAVIGRSGEWRAEWRAWETHGEALLGAWREAHQRWSPGDLDSDPDWCRGVAEVYPGAVHLAVLRRRGEIIAVVPMLLKRAELDCHLGEFKVFRFQPRVAELAGAATGLPEEVDAYHAFFAGLLGRGGVSRLRFDALRFTLSTQSRLWAYLSSPEFARYGLRRFQPLPPAAHHLIRLPESFPAYLAKFTPKTRKNRFRELKYLEQKGAVELACFRNPSQVDAFLEQAQAISRRSYQHRLLNVGLRAPEQLRRRLEIAAEHGWLRSYVLRCGGVNCSYMLGYQYQGHYHYVKVGYDPAWAELCVGTVLQLLVLQHLFETDTPAVFDFGALGPQKQYFGNDQFEEGAVLFFRRRPYPWLARASFHASRRLTARSSQLLERYRLKARVQRLLRRAAGC